MISEGKALRELLQLAANAVSPSPDGMARIRARIAEPRRPWWRRIFHARKNGAPVVETGTPPNTAAPLKGSTAMAIIHHEDASLYGKGVVHHPLSGRPEFKGLLDGADGPMARIQDGDLVLTIDDMATLLRWRDVFQLAAAQLQMGMDRAAKNGGAA